MKKLTNSYWRLSSGKCDSVVKDSCGVSGSTHPASHGVSERMNKKVAAAAVGIFRDLNRIFEGIYSPDLQ